MRAYLRRHFCLRRRNQLKPSLNFIWRVRPSLLFINTYYSQWILRVPKMTFSFGYQFDAFANDLNE